MKNISNDKYLNQELEFWNGEEGNPDVAKKIKEKYQPENKSDGKNKEEFNGDKKKIKRDETKKPFKPVKGFTSITPDKDHDEIYEGKTLGVWSAPMEGWDEEHEDTVALVQKDDGFYVDGYISFGEFEAQGPFKTQKEAEKEVKNQMEALKEEWKDEDDY